MISGFQALGQARAPVAGLNSATECPCRSQDELASHFATDASIGMEAIEEKKRQSFKNQSRRDLEREVKEMGASWAETIS
ncbi:hypothetical protein PoB_007001900 [Plakobranchus ocellatus]|uniref:Uncharacterized protein n=1 Tax=Plakobranchus ocellatus TaxID=259542 RepID=A0AAV4DHK5_9GAST|nr:hypothetical protein PoB_007001900 [Plakobranchus ocellatus]